MLMSYVNAKWCQSLIIHQGLHLPHHATWRDNAWRLRSRSTMRAHIPQRGTVAEELKSAHVHPPIRGRTTLIGQSATKPSMKSFTRTSNTLLHAQTGGRKSFLARGSPDLWLSFCCGCSRYVRNTYLFFEVHLASKRRISINIQNLNPRNCIRLLQIY